MITALLPMKGHSERVPGKNFKPIAGKPLYRWILDTLLSMEEVDRVVINTDAREQVSRDLPRDGRILVRDRPEAIRGDHVSMNRIIADDLEHVEAGLFLQTHTTNPLLQATTIRAAIERLQSDGAADSLFTATPWQTRFYWQDGRPVNHDPTELRRTQDLPPLLEENSNLYLFTPDSFRAADARIGRNPIMHPMDRNEAIDIDDEASWRIAEALLATQVTA